MRAMMDGTREKGPAMHLVCRSIRELPFYRFAFGDSKAGRILVIMSECGVVDVISGDTHTELLHAASDRHPTAGFAPDEGVHAHWVAAIVSRIDRADGEYSVPLHHSSVCERRAAS